ncbi:MAG: DUF2232 domain-containing protein [Gemmatimonadetes bacterium]|nr:DUF2232 domain-containing protein [Gemmatimonadota bacterium]
MAPSLERPPAGGLGRLVLVAVAFGLLVPAPLFAFPLALMLVSSRPERRAEVLLAALAGGLSVWWLLQPGNPPDQVLRTGLLLSTVAFMVLSRSAALSFTHRALIAIGVATAGVAVLFVAFGWSWDQLHWWVITQRTHEGGEALAVLRAGSSGGNAAATPLIDHLQTVLARSAAFEADNYAAMTGLKLLAGLALATGLYHRVATHPRGAALGRFRDFRFTEHLGWAAAIPLAIVLLPDLIRAKVAASNMLLLVGALYALRGLAVAAFVAGLAGTGPIATALAVMAAFFMLPVVLGGGILLGVLDAGMDLRRRWKREQ